MSGICFKITSTTITSRVQRQAWRNSNGYCSWVMARGVHSTVHCLFSMLGISQDSFKGVRWEDV